MGLVGEAGGRGWVAGEAQWWWELAVKEVGGEEVVGGQLVGMSSAITSAPSLPTPLSLPPTLSPLCLLLPAASVPTTSTSLTTLGPHPHFSHPPSKASASPHLSHPAIAYSCCGSSKSCTSNQARAQSICLLQCQPGLVAVAAV